jgi:very-short-patch-repair endonuclease
MVPLFQYNDPKLKPRRKKLRNASTHAEIELWSLLKKSQISNKKFRRQYGVGPYILDFYCPEERLALELDGSSHDSDAKQAYDKERSTYLQSLDITVLRFENRAVYEAPEWLINEIKKHFR